MKSTAIAPSNIAFIKYWGKKDDSLRLPTNGSVAVNLSNLFTTTTVDFSTKYSKDLIIINGESDLKESDRVIKHLDRVRKLANITTKAQVVSKNNFLTASGMASSASGFAALSLAASHASGLQLSNRDVSILARQGSGSACRSIPDGFTEWLNGDTSDTSYAVSILPPDYWDLSILVVQVESEGKKHIGSTDAMKNLSENPFFQARLSHIKQKIELIKKLMRDKNFEKFGELIEAEALELHVMAFTSRPPIVYWEPGTIRVMKVVQRLRQQGVLVYFTIDAGPHLHLICQKEDTKKVQEALKETPDVKQVILNVPAAGAHLVPQHLF